MGVKYRNTFYSQAGTVWTLDIGDTSYSSTVLLFKTDAEGFSLNYKGITERCDPILSSTCNVPFVVENSTMQAFITDVMTAQEERFTLQIYKDNTLYWSGVLLADQVQREDEYYPYVVDLTFTDGLGRLKDLEYTGDGYDGRVTLLQHVINCLNRTGVAALYGATDPYLTTAINWYDVRHVYSQSRCTLAYTNLNYAVFAEIDKDGNAEYKSCGDVLEMILRTFNARVQMTNGRWHITQIMDYNRTFFYTRTFDKSANYLSSLATNYKVTVAAGYRKTGGVFKYMQPFRLVKKKYKPRISSLETDSILPIQATYTPAVDLLNIIPGDIIVHLDGKVRERFWLEDPIDPDLGPPVQLYSKWKLEFVLTGALDTYYLTNKNNGIFEWSTSSADFVTLRGPILQSYTGWDNTWPFSISTPPAPEECTGTFKFTLINLYNAGNNTVFTIGDNFYLAEYYNFTVLLDLTDELADCTEIEFTAENTITGGGTVASTAKLELPETLIGDGPQVVHIGKLMSSNGSTYDESTAWGVHNSTSRANINQLAVNLILKGQRVPVERFSGGFISTTATALSGIVFDYKIYAPIQIKIDPVRDEIIGEWFNAIIPA